MNETRERDLWFLSTMILVIALLYLWHEYSVIFEDHKGYIYDPAKDKMYSISYIDRIRDRWTNIKTFSSDRHTGEIKYATELGTVEHLIDKTIKQNKLLSEKRYDEYNAMTEIIVPDDFSNDIFYDIHYFDRRDLKPEKLLYNTKLSFANKYKTVKVVDVVVFRWKLMHPSPEERKPEIEIIKDAVMIYGKAAIDPWFCEIGEFCVGKDNMR